MVNENVQKLKYLSWINKTKNSDLVKRERRITVPGPPFRYQSIPRKVRGLSLDISTPSRTCGPSTYVREYSSPSSPCPSFLKKSMNAHLVPFYLEIIINRTYDHRSVPDIKSVCVQCTPRTQQTSLVDLNGLPSGEQGNESFDDCVQRQVCMDYFT